MGPAFRIAALDRESDNGRERAFSSAGYGRHGSQRSHAPCAAAVRA